MNDDNILAITRDEPAAAKDVPAVSHAQLYKLDWADMDVKLAKGRFCHTLRRPTTDEVLARENDLQAEIQINKDGSYAMPDPTATEEVDARYYDQIVQQVKGYAHDKAVPELHKSAAFQAMYRREVEVDEDCDVLGSDEIAIVEEIGTGAVPDFTVRHIMRPPSEAELKTYRRRANATSEIRQGKRGRQVLSTRSNLRNSMQHYALWLVRIEGASVAGEAFTDANRAAFIDAVDPLIQRRVVAELADAFAGGLLD